MTASGTTPPRLPLVETPEDPTLREQFDKLASGSGVLNLHRMMVHASALMKASGDMAMAFRRDTELPRALAELAILRAAQVIASDYVFGRHLPLARASGVTERQLAELKHWTDSAAPSRRRKRPHSASPRRSRKGCRSRTALLPSCGGIFRHARSSS